VTGGGGGFWIIKNLNTHQPGQSRLDSDILPKIALRYKPKVYFREVYLTTLSVAQTIWRTIIE
jgi:hypothetical protein